MLDTRGLPVLIAPKSHRTLHVVRKLSQFLLAAMFLMESPIKPAGQEAAAARVRVQLRDERGQPITARVYVRDAAAKAYAPAGAVMRQIRSTGESYFHAEGHFELEMPAGDVTVEAVKGFEYHPAKATMHVQPGQAGTVTLTLARLIDLPARGWYSGDVHMHPNHVEGGLEMTMQDCRLVAAGEDVRVANLLISSGDSAHVFDTEFFTRGQPDPLSTRETLMVVQEEFRNTSAMYGHMPLLGISKLVEPFHTGLQGSPNWEDYPPNYTIARQARAQGGAVSYAHPADRPETPVGAHLAREFPIDLALGEVDALDILSNRDEEAACWMYYRVLNCGLRCTASAGTDSRMDVERHAVPGGQKVFVKAGNPLTYPKWVAAYKAGRTFVSNGPLLFLSIEGKEPGDEIHLSGAGMVRVEAEAHSIVPMSTLEIVVNGEVVASAKPDGDRTVTQLTSHVEIKKSSWVAARVWGERHRWVVDDPKAFAHTSPVYCYVGNGKIASREDARLVVQWIDRLLQDVESSPRFSDEKKRNEVINLFRQGRRYYQQMAAEE